MTESSVDKTPDESNDVPQPPSLKKRVIRGSMWTLGGHVTSQVIRLGSNLIVTRLLFPEAFGLMGLVYTFTSALELLSDLGIQPNVIQSQRGDAKFLNTAWTLAIIRGFVLWIGACLIGWPVSQFYKEPILMYLLPVVGFNIFVQGFVSTKLWIANRNLELRKLTIIDVVTQVLGVTIMVVAAGIAYVTKAPPDVAIWALAIAGLPASLLKVFLSHVYISGMPNRLDWEPESFQELQRFGRWIFLSSLLAFFAVHGNNLLVPKLTSIAFFGFFSIAYNLSRLAGEILNMVNSRVLYASYAELVRDRPERLYPALRRARLVLNGLNWGVSLFFIIFGKALIEFMYDPRYADVGWILQLLSLSNLLVWLGSTYMNVLMAQGKTFIMSMLMAVQVFLQFACIFAGYYFSSPATREFGIVLGIVAVGWLLYPVQAFFLARNKLWQPEVDLPTFVAATGVAALFIFKVL